MSSVGESKALLVLVSTGPDVHTYSIPVAAVGDAALALLKRMAKVDMARTKSSIGRFRSLLDQWKQYKTSAIGALQPEYAIRMKV
jgi:hypothetical protein